MTGRDDEDRGQLAPFADDATGDLDERAAAVRPDFAAMMARARALAAEHDARAPAPVIALTDPGDDDDELEADAGLAPFTAALRGELDDQLHERSLAGIPPLPALPSRGRRLALALGLVAAAAAALVLLVGGDRLALQVDRGGRGVEANAARQDDAPDGTARAATPAREARHTAPPADPPAEDSPVPGDSVAAGEHAPEVPVAQTPVPGDSREVGAPAPGRRSEARRPRPPPPDARARGPEPRGGGPGAVAARRARGRRAEVPARSCASPTAAAPSWRSATCSP